jgi:hypothetical protein
MYEKERTDKGPVIRNMNIIAGQVTFFHKLYFAHLCFRLKVDDHHEQTGNSSTKT